MQQVPEGLRPEVRVPLLQHAVSKGGQHQLLQKQTGKPSVREAQLMLPAAGGLAQGYHEPYSEMKDATPGKAV